MSADARCSVCRAPLRDFITEILNVCSGACWRAAQAGNQAQTLEDQSSISQRTWRDAFHASAPPGMKCMDCTGDNPVPCPDCYAAWWSKAHPHHRAYGGVVEAASKANLLAIAAQELVKYAEHAPHPLSMSDETLTLLYWCSQVRMLSAPFLPAVPARAQTDDG